MSNQEVTGQVSSDQTGKYTILMELGSGGSATVSAAMVKGLAGFSKVVVLKTIRDGLVSDDATIRMFLGEARLSARMNHPNVVQVYEVYKKNNLPVIVMEYLEGQSLAVVLPRGRQDGLFPRDIGLAILAKTLAGLHYAHNLTDYSGEPLHLVHRDVSPHNVMVCYDGQVKLVDFGIAKLKNQDGQTRTGVIKGKLNYMAPEQVTGDVSHPADIFAVGVMLFEVLTGQRFWGDATDPVIIGKLLTGDLPSLSDAAPDLDPELHRICSRALAIKVADRYAHAADMQKDLEDFLRRQETDVSQTAIASLMTQTCNDLREVTKAALQQKVMAMAGSVTGEIDTTEGNDSGAAAHVVTQTSAVDRKSSRAWLVGAAGLSASLVVALAFSLRASPPPPETITALPQVAAPPPAAPAPTPASVVPQRVRVALVVAPQEARLYIDDRRLSSNPFTDSLPRDTVEHTFRAEADGFEPFTRVIRLDSDLDLTLSLRAQQVQKPQAAAPPRYRPRPTAVAPRPASPPPLEPVKEAASGKEAPPPALTVAAPGEDLRLDGRRGSRRVVEFDDPYDTK